MDELVGGLAFGDGPRWHEGRLWLSDLHAGVVLSVGLDGDTRDEAVVPGSPSGLGWLPDGSLLVVSMTDRRVLRRTADGTLAEHADLSTVATFHANDMVVDGRGNAYVGNMGSDFVPGTKRAPADLALVRPDGSVERAATGLGFPNGSVVTPDGATLIVAETMARRLVAYPIGTDGSLGERRTWADLGDGFPDGIALDAEGAVWFADPRVGACVRVAEGGEVLARVDTPERCYACALGGDDRRTLLLLTASVDDPAEALRARSGRVLSVAVEVPGVGWP